MTTSNTYVGFDMGIRNLAYCMIEHTNEDKWNIKAWDNVDLLENGVSAQNAKKCDACGAAAKWIGESRKWCNACATGVRRKKSAKYIPTLPTLPSLKGLKEQRAFAAEKGMADTKKAGKDTLCTWFTERYLMPWKPEKAGNVSLQTICQKMDIWLNSILPTLALASRIRLENQPVMKGPTMKSVQIILFTLLTHRLQREYDWHGSIEFVHAGVKTRAAEAAADEGKTELKDGEAYKKRKQTAETEVERLLTEHSSGPWRTFFHSRTKKSDLADAFLMALRK
jgi:hypothetical protein